MCGIHKTKEAWTNLELNCENLLQLHNWIESINDSFNHYWIHDRYIFVSLLI